MSTRGAIAYRAGDGWEGVYNHSDSYPTGLGKELWAFINGGRLAFSDETAEAHGAQALVDLIKVTPQGFSAFDAINRTKVERALATYAADSPYRDTMVQMYGDGRFDGPHGAYTSTELQGTEPLRGCYPDPVGWKRETRYGVTEPNSMEPCGDTTCDPLFMEWVYVIDADAQIMTILASRSVEVDGPGHDMFRHKDRDTIKGGCNLMFDCSPTRTPGRSYRPSHWVKDHTPETRYRHEVMAQVSLTGDEPDWGAIEGLRRSEEAA